MAEDNDERTEEATQQRREDFRRRGQVANTRELATVLILFGTALCMWSLGRFMLQQVSEIFTESLTTYIIAAARAGDYVPAMIFVAKKTAIVLGPLLGILVIMSAASTVLQVGFLNNEEALQFKLDKIDPISGFKRIFSLRALIEGFKAVLKVTLISALVLMILRKEVEVIPSIIQFSIEQIMSYVGLVTMKILAAAGLFMALLAGLDYFFQRWELEKQMRMTKQEIKEEHKTREGDPLVKARIRRVQREMAQKRMMEDVPKADVIVTNPTHIAVALMYNDKLPAPKVVAMGADIIAEKIKELARKHNVPIVENKPLARTMFKTMKIGQVVPRELFTAVAEVLSYVYRLKKKVLR